MAGTRDRRIVIKLGTGVLTRGIGELDTARMGAICAQVADALKGGWKPILVSSGAVGLGMEAAEDVLLHRHIRELFHYEPAMNTRNLGIRNRDNSNQSGFITVFHFVVLLQPIITWPLDNLP